MFSVVRRTLYPHPQANDHHRLDALRWSIVNFRTRSLAVRRWVRNEDGMNMICGKGWSAAYTLLRGAARLPGCKDDEEGVVADISVQGHSHAPEHDPTPLSSAEQDEASSPTPSLCSTLQEMPDDTPDGCYVALTIPHPTASLRDFISALPESKTPGSFLSALLADPAFHDGRVFPLRTSRRTCTGVHRAVLIGDASHGMVPYCGAGASSALRDASHLVSLVQNHTSEWDLDPCAASDETNSTNSAPR